MSSAAKCESMPVSVASKCTEHSTLLGKKLLRIMAVWLPVALVCMVFGLAEPARAVDGGNGSGDKKILIVYYSRSGNTRALAEHIRAATGGDLLELQPAQPYPAEYKATTEQAKRELESNYLPPLADAVPSVAAYDMVLVGSPNWWSTVAGPVRTFLSQTDLSGKPVAVFITHEGSGLGRSVVDVKKLCPKAIVLEGLAVRGGRVGSAAGLVQEWLRTIGAIR